MSLDFEGERIAYDICPVNIVLNHYAKKLDIPYDEGGRLASTGEVDGPLLNALNDLAFYKQNFPKSLGVEWVNENIFPRIDQKNRKVENILRTVVEHITDQIALELNKESDASVLITGGGAYNTFLIDRLKEKTKNQIHIPNSDLVEFKEAIIFGFLGILKLRNEVNCLKSVTGASKNHSSGKIFLP